MKKKVIVDSLMYLVVFAAIQVAVELVAAFLRQTHEATPMLTIATSIISGLLTIALFAWRRWAPVSGKYINQRPWFTLFWVVCLAGGSAMPLTFALEQMGLTMPDFYTQLFKEMMQHDLGFLAVGVLAPVAEEMVFRGAILRRLLDATGRRMAWIAIVVTAALFGLVHGNMVQGINAFLLGLILGWMYVRTRSVVPGIVFHFTNNAIAFFSYRLFPDAADKTLLEFYGGNMTHVLLAVAFSLMIFGAALYQLNLRLCKLPAGEA